MIFLSSAFKIRGKRLVCLIIFYSFADVLLLFTITTTDVHTSFLIWSVADNNKHA